ncbi:MAG: ATP synthase F1 subunit epsilon [Pseudanabaenaceae cyanobacterium SKYGB_i_bin29]|nr:ATP synthase F1 subunit epsilon [Pseudanabaenaceae cyanobacterium SKYG29]MDW8422265.1 ATP synthase F1 subunit epsilon [Pseudanabaenaceae cyanobacterium SKYGB_i_bin29]
MTLMVRVLAPDRVILDQAAEELVLPSTTGQLGILTDHAPLMTALDYGVLRYRVQNHWSAIAVLGGFAEIEENEVTVLVNEAEMGDTIDPEQAQKEFTEAEAHYQQVANGNPDPLVKMQAERALKRARARLQATTKLE